MNDRERRFSIQQCRDAGLTDDEMFEHPTEGLCISASGVRKLARLAPDKARAVRVIEQLEAVLVRRSDASDA